MRVRVTSSQVRAPLLLLAAIEALILLSSLYFAAFILFDSVEECERVLGWIAPKALLLAGLVLIGLTAMGLYQFNQRMDFRGAVLRVLVGIGACFFVTAFCSFIFPAIAIDRQILTIAFGYSLSLLLVSRYAFLLTVDENVFRRRTLIYGAGRRAEAMMSLRRSADRRGFRIVGRIAAPGDDCEGDSEVSVLKDGQTITDLALATRAEEIVIAMDERRGKLPVGELLDARLHGIDVVDLVGFLERETGKIRLDLVDPGWLIFSAGFRISKYRQFWQRAIDLVVSVGLLTLTLPVMLLVAVAIKIEDGLRAPVFYRQRRVGKGDKEFQILKFRSMRVDAETGGTAVWASKNDDRITVVGGFLRKARIDELPQVINVFRGQMSLIGPRPERPEFVQNLKKSIPYYHERHAVKPGVTGWAQVRYAYGSSEEDAIEKLQYDLYYIKNQSMMLDIMIILQTVEVVLWGKGAR
jgi:sugar transferase (PEP-CTERM system associated)